MKVLKNYWLLLFILLTVIWMLKMYFGFYFPENIYNSFVILKDFQLTFFLGVLTYKLYTNKKRKEILNQEIKIQKIRKLELEKNHSGRDYVLEQRENEETLNINENKLMMLENKSIVFDNFILMLTATACSLQILCFLGQKI